MTREATLEVYNKSGVNLMPIPKGEGKARKTAWKKYQEEKCSEVIQADQDFAVITGKTSDNLVVLDYDHLEELTDEDSPFKDILNQTLVVKSGNGFHVYLKLERPLKKVIYKKERKICEIQAQGQYVIGASSNHYDKDENDVYYKSGKKYIIISNVTEIKETTTLELTNRLIKKKWILKKEISSKILLDELERGDWDEGERYTNGFRLCLKWFHKGKSKDEVLAKLTKINTTCNPPHIIEQVKKIVNDAEIQYKKNKEEEKEKKRELTENKKRNTWDSITKQIMSEKSFITISKTEKILTFDGKRLSEHQAKSYIQKRVDELVPYESKNFGMEVLQKIKVRTLEEIERFDSEPEKITADNGILNITTLELTPHTPENLTTLLIPNEYVEPEFPIADKTIFEDVEKNLKDTLFWKFITSSHTIDGIRNQESVETALEAIARAFIKRQIDARAIMHLGHGDNGKSVFLDYVKDLVGEENTSNIQLQQLTESRFASSGLLKKMLNTFTDLESNNSLKNSGLIKTILSGEGINAEFKNGQPFNYSPFCVMQFSCNRFPKSFDQSQGYFRRWIILRWKKNFENNPERDEKLLDKLKANKEEKNKVFSAIVHLSRRLLKNGKFTHSKDWKTVQREWNANADPLDNFVSFHCEEGETNATLREMYDWYKEKTYEIGEHPLGIGQFGKAFSQYYLKIKNDRSWYWENVQPKRLQTKKMCEYEKP